MFSHVKNLLVKTVRMRITRVLILLENRIFLIFFQTYQDGRVLGVFL